MNAYLNGIRYVYILCNNTEKERKDAKQKENSNMRLSGGKKSCLFLFIKECIVYWIYFF